MDDNNYVLTIVDFLLTSLDVDIQL